MTAIATGAGTALGLVEVGGWSVAMVVLDAMDKSATLRVLQAELNDLNGVLIKIRGRSGDLRAALDAARATATRMGADIIAQVIDNPAPASAPAYTGLPEFSPLLEAPVTFDPDPQYARKETPMPADQASFAIGLIETQGFIAVIEAIDTACKAANVEVLGREKLGGGYISVVIKGDVAAVRAAIDAGKSRVEGLGKLIAAHVIPRPSPAVLSLLPKQS